MLKPWFIIVSLVGLTQRVASIDLINDDGDLPFHQKTIIMSHNSAANKDAANGDFIKLVFGVDQEESIYDQLSKSVRGLSLDIKIDTSDWSKLRLVHGPLDFGDFDTEMQKHLVRFLEENLHVIVVICFEVIDGPSVHGDDWQAIRSAIFTNLKRTFSTLRVNGVSLADMTFKYDLWDDDDHDEWPTYNEMRKSGQRLFVLHDRSDFRSLEYGFMYRNDVMKENYWEGLDDCIERYEWNSDKVSFPNSKLSWSRLFFMNHFDSVASTVGDGLLGGGTNGWGSVYPRIKMCMESNGFTKPTIISLDWVVQLEEALEVVSYLNFGGPKIGSGQRCTDNSHCATEVCNTMLGLCQCKVCDSLGFGSESCIGCEAQENCVAVANSLNQCLALSSQEPSSAQTLLPTNLPTSSFPTAFPTTYSPTNNSTSYQPTAPENQTTLIPTVSTSPTQTPTTTLIPTASTSPTQTPRKQSQASLLHIPETVIVGAESSINSASKEFVTTLPIIVGILGLLFLF